MDPVVYWKILVSLSVSLGSVFKNFTFSISKKAPLKILKEIKKKKKSLPNPITYHFGDLKQVFFLHYFSPILLKMRLSREIITKVDKRESPNEVAGT